MGKKWERTPEQEAYLQEKLLFFSDARNNGRQGRYFADLCEGWFQWFPESKILFGENVNPDALEQVDRAKLAEAISLRKEQLKNFVYWHTDANHSGRRSEKVKGLTLAELLKGKRPKVHRQMRLLDVYSSMYFDQKIRPVLDGIMESCQSTGRKYSSIRMSHLQRLKKEFWDKESEIVRNEVEERWKSMQAKGIDLDEEGNEAEEKGDKGAKKPNSKAAELKHLEKEISCLGVVLDRVAKELHEQTGWVMTILVGGLQPNGELEYTALHNGKTPEGQHNFRDSTVDFEESVMRPWCLFLESVFPDWKQKAQADSYRDAFKIKCSADLPAAKPVDQDLWKFDEEEGEGPDVENDDLMPSTSGRSSTTSTNIPVTLPLTPSASTEALNLVQHSVVTDATLSPPVPTEAVSQLTPPTPPLDVITPTPDINAPGRTGSANLFFAPDASVGDTSVPLILPGSQGYSTGLWEDHTTSSSPWNFPSTNYGPLMQELHSGLDPTFAETDHAALLRQNSVSNAGMDMSQNYDIGMNMDLGQDYWKNLCDGLDTFGFPGSVPLSNLNVDNMNTSNAPSAVPAPTALNACTTIPPPSADFTTPADNPPPSTIPSNVVPVDSITPLSTSTADTDDTSVNDSSMDQSTAVEQAKNQKKRRGRLPREPASPLVDVTSQTNNSSHPRREHKQKRHRDAVFEEAQEAREHKRRKGKERM